MKYNVHRLNVDGDNMQDNLDRFINSLKGEIIAIIPNVKPTFLGMGATAKVNYLLVVEKL